VGSGLPALAVATIPLAVNDAALLPSLSYVAFIWSCYDMISRSNSETIVLPTATAARCADIGLPDCVGYVRGSTCRETSSFFGGMRHRPP
jgi:hypothetical protein